MLTVPYKRLESMDASNIAIDIFIHDGEENSHPYTRQPTLRLESIARRGGRFKIFNIGQL